MKKIFVLLVGTMFFAMGHINAQDKPLIRYDEDTFMKVANKVNQKDYNTLISFAEKSFKEYFKHKGIQVDFTETDYYAHDTCVTSYQKLLKDKNGLAVAKQTAEDNFKVEKNRADSLQGVIDGLNRRIGGNDNILNEMSQKMKRLNDSINTVLAQKDDSIRMLTTERDTLQSQRSRLASQNQTLSARNTDLEQAQKKFDEVFDKAETQIDNIYNANMEKSCSGMKADELQKALKAYDGIASLIQIHPLSDGIQDKVNQITAWSHLKVALEEAVKYMEGKYNNTTRTACISNLSKIANLSGRQLDEKNTVLQAMKDQAQVNAKFNELLDYLRDGFFVIPDKKVAQDALKLIDGQTVIFDNDRITIKVNPNATYHKKHAEALQELRSIMTNAAANGPKQNLQLEANFQKVVENIRSKFQ